MTTTTTLEQIKLQEPEATSFYEGRTIFIVVLGNGSKVCMSKQAVEGMLRECLVCKQQVRLYRSRSGGWVKYNQQDGTLHSHPRKQQRPRKESEFSL